MPGQSSLSGFLYKVGPADEQRGGRGQEEGGRGQWEEVGRRGRDVNLDEGLNSLKPSTREKVRDSLFCPLPAAVRGARWHSGNQLMEVVQ